MADWLADVKKYAPNADEKVVAGMQKTYALVLSRPDAAYVSASDAAELVTVRENFLKKKLGLTQDDATLDAAVKDVVATMKDGSKNSRIAMYYLLAEKFNKLDMFR